ncbi:Uncharacterized protein BP5553_06223 [Venustampulla echinocandica]|uniref:Uncharacterized protein n=1 Tax=Venustampulla echinocandica TaxID=2656787 RepID=A0A370TMX8_9HELO|nr:Uncharacterized protein BP5553_06223 [Venustampulla echinocandica]RDL36871.1 Uncharacterized protein BP5553_06223 [Venustampulla echinocandica]
MEEPTSAGKEKTKHRFMGKLFKEKKTTNTNHDIDTFLHGPSDELHMMPAPAGPTNPHPHPHPHPSPQPPSLSRIDTSSARRWPTAAEINNSRINRGRSASPPRSRKGLAVRFTNEQPEVIGEGGDEATTPVSDIGVRKRAHSHPPGRQPPQAQAQAPSYRLDTTPPANAPGHSQEYQSLDPFRDATPLRRTATGIQPTSARGPSTERLSRGLAETQEHGYGSTNNGSAKDDFDPTSFAARIRAEMRSGEGKALVQAALTAPDFNDLRPGSSGEPESEITPQLKELRLNTMRNSYISTSPVTSIPTQRLPGRSVSPAGSQLSIPMTESPLPLSRTSTLQAAATAVVDDALHDFSSRVAHFFTLFRLSVESVKPIPRCSLEELVRAALWWFLKGRSNLEATVRDRPTSPQAQKLRQFVLQQAYTDLAKSLWLIEIVTTQRPEVVDPFAQGAPDPHLASILESRQAIISSLRKVTMSMKRNNFLPPVPNDAPLPQGLDNSIWVPEEGDKSLVANQRPSLAITLAETFPLGDSSRTFFFGRCFAQGVLEEEAASQRFQCPVLVSLVRGQKEKEISALIVSQDGSLKICIQADRTRGTTWGDVAWQAKSSTIKVDLPRGFSLRLHCSEQDFGMIWGSYDRQAKIHDYLNPRREEELIFESVIRNFKYIDQSPESRFPKDPLYDCYLRIFEMVKLEKGAAAARTIHRGFRVALNTNPRTKNLDGINQKLPPNRAIQFGFLRGDDGQPAIMLKIAHGGSNCRMIMAFDDVNQRSRLHQLLTGSALGDTEGFVAEGPMKAFSIAGYSPNSQDLSCLKTLDWQGFRVINEDEGDLQTDKAVLSNHLRVALDFTTGSLTDRINVEPGELKLRLDVKSAKELKILRQPQEDMTVAVIESQVSQELPRELSALLDTIAQSQSARTYLFPGLQELHLFQAALTGFNVLYDGMASSFNISRRRMVVPIYKKWDAASTRVQVVQRDKVVQLVAFFENFSHGDCMNFALKSTDVFECSGRSGKYSLRIVDAKFALPKPPQQDDAVGHQFVCLDMPEYPGEHDDITIVFDTESELDKLTKALPAPVKIASRMASIKR